MKMEYLKCLTQLSNITTNTGEIVEVFELADDIDTSSFDEWAKHFRQQYCPDDAFDTMVRGTGLTKEQFLIQRKFPDETDDFGPGTRSGDFGELLVSDYLEFILGYSVPRDKYKIKFNRNTSMQGTDVIAYKIQGTKYSPQDELLTFEVKTQASKGTSENRLQDAINDSKKDEPIRKGETLSALKQLYFDKNELKKVMEIERFQNKPDNPYREIYGAAAVYDAAFYSPNDIKAVNLYGLKRRLIVIKRNSLMKLIHELYKRAAQC